MEKASELREAYARAVRQLIEHYKKDPALIFRKRA